MPGPAGVPIRVTPGRPSKAPRKMSVAEKVRLLESVWESQFAHPGDVQSPEWHREVLEDRRRRLEDGLATVSAWTDAKARLMQLAR